MWNDAGQGPKLKSTFHPCYPRLLADLDLERVTIPSSIRCQERDQVIGGAAETGARDVKRRLRVSLLARDGARLDVTFIPVLTNDDGCDSTWDCSAGD